MLPTSNTVGQSKMSVQMPPPVRIKTIHSSDIRFGQNLWKRIQTTLKRTQKPDHHIPNFVENFAEAVFINDNEQEITGKDILKYFVANKRRLDGQPGEPNYMFGQDAPGKAYGSRYAWVLDKIFGFQSKETNLSMLRLLTLDDLLSLQENKEEDSPANPLYLSQKAQKLLRLANMVPEERAAYLNKYPYNYPAVSNSHQPPPTSQENSQKSPPGMPYGAYGYVRPQIQPGIFKRFKILLRYAIPLGGALGIVYYLTSTPSESISQNDPIQQPATSPSISAEKTPSSTQLPQENQLKTVEQALTLAKAGKFKRQVTEVNHHNGFYSYQFKSMYEAGARVGRTYTLPYVQETQRQMLLNGLRDARFSVEASEKSDSITNHPEYLIGGTLMALVAVSILVHLRNRKNNAKMRGRRQEFLQRQLPQNTPSPDRENLFLPNNKGFEVDITPKERFSDVGGNYLAKSELISFLNKLQKRLSGDNIELSKGIAFEGPPGTGKTLLAKALAGEAGVPCIDLGGSDFDEMFVGVGASRVRDLFRTAREQAYEHGACIIFIDEIDSVGKRREKHGSSGSSERENTLTALLKEMDGFRPRENIFVLAATNRYDMLDPALKRRFTQSISVENPQSNQERQEILQIHLKRLCKKYGLTLDTPQSIDAMASLTRGLSGDALYKTVHGAIDITMDQNRQTITLDDLVEGFQSHQFGKKVGIPIGNAEREKTAHHEHGHGLLGLASGISPFIVSMFQRGKSLGRVALDPRFFSEVSRTKKDYLAEYLILVGGTTAEEAGYGDLGRTSGHAGDLEMLDQKLRQMLTLRFLDTQYAPNVLNSQTPFSESQMKLAEQFNQQALQAANAIIQKVGPERMSNMVKESLELDKELIGPEALAFYQKHIGPDLLKELQEIADSFFKNPTGNK